MTEQTGDCAVIHHYTIRVQGYLDRRWSAWFEGLTIRHIEDDTILEGPVADQAALQGLVIKLGSLNLSLISVQRLPASEETESQPEVTP